MHIGDWVRRVRGQSPFHLVDSLVAEDVVTRCGRRMGPYDIKGRYLLRAAAQPALEWRCIPCWVGCELDG